MRTISFTEARTHLRAILDQTAEDADGTIITRRDKEDAIVLSLREYNSLMETVYLLGTPANAAHLAESIAQHQRGEVVERPLSEPETEEA
jgi:antitoxin YefM